MVQGESDYTQYSKSRIRVRWLCVGNQPTTKTDCYLEGSASCQRPTRSSRITAAAGAAAAAAATAATAAASAPAAG